MENIFRKPTYRVKNIGFRLNDEELKNLQALCVSQKLSISKVARIAINEYATKAQKERFLKQN